MDTQNLLKLIAELITELQQTQKQLDDKTNECDAFFSMYQEATGNETL